MKDSSPGVPSFIDIDKVSPEAIEKLVSALRILPSGNLDICMSKAVGVAALQVQVKIYNDLPGYIADMNSYIAKAVNHRAQIIVMPALAGLLPITTAPLGHAHLMQLNPAEKVEGVNYYMVGGAAIDPLAVRNMMSDISGYAFEAYFHTMSMLAARHRVYIMAGSTIYFDDYELCHRALLFNDQGTLAGYQDKISQGPLELALGVRPGSEVKVFDTPMGPMSILVGSDASYFEIARVATRLGAKILLCPGVFVNAYGPVDSRLGANMRAQENHIYAVLSSMVGETGLGFSLEGGGRLFAPNEFLIHKNGVAAKTSGRHSPDVASLLFNLDRLDDIENPYTQDINEEFMLKNIERLY